MNPGSMSRDFFAVYLALFTKINVRYLVIFATFQAKSSLLMVYARKIESRFPDFDNNYKE